MNEDRPLIRPRSALRALGALGAMLAATSSGCATHLQLQKDTVATNLGVADMYHQQVLYNVARFSMNPASLPSFSVIQAGTVNVQDLCGGGVSPTYSPTLTRALQGNGALPILSLLFSSNVQRSITENWSTLPVTDSDNLRRMRCAFQLLVGQEVSECDRCEERLKCFFVGGSESHECMLPRGWYCLGCKEDVPKCACYVANYGNLYVWVMPDGLDGLARFTITILDIATGEVHTPTQSVVRHFKGEPKPENLESTEITTTEVDRAAIDSGKKYQLERKHPNNEAINRGLFFLEP